ncbi:MAG: DNA-binding NarL/FixJ family response regulator [Crocinitomicaceae bacterium]|jgi:DNA-binding NarL/FixJ family response regulator
MSNKIKIALADDHRILLETLTVMLGNENDMEVVISAPNGKELLTDMKNSDVDVVLLDLDMPVMDGRATLPIIKQYHKKVKVIILSFHDSLFYMKKFLNEGADAYISKGTDFEILLKAIRSVYKEGFYFCERVTKEVLIKWNENKRNRHSVLQGDPLTTREKEVVQLICEGKSNGEISLELHLSQRTVENHRMRISKKTGTNSTASIVVYAVTNGIYEIEF